MRKLILLALILVVGAGTIFYFKNTLKKTEAKIHYHAGFLVYKDGKKEDFSDIRYMDLKPCNEKPGKEKPEDPQKEKAHLHDSVGDVVHVENKGAVWGDLFTNINYKIENIKDVKGYINGEKVEDVLSWPIKSYDSALFVIGSDRGVDLKQVVSKDHIVEIGDKNEDCGQ